jgi:hypothetical protein
MKYLLLLNTPNDGLPAEGTAEYADTYGPTARPWPRWPRRAC